ncbi:hypothetical protein AeMF1_011312 [Aphanomyces euteiches]|nr:hypothetical protein AeMF1_011312 [Aphanomyces euteiches]KAH9186151.1 hypothetical protein AeNC1_011871 [Aphanomyces euteiches]
MASSTYSDLESPAIAAKPKLAHRRRYLPLLLVPAMVLAMVVAFFLGHAIHSQPHQNGYRVLYKAQPTNNSGSTAVAVTVVVSAVNLDTYDVTLTAHLDNADAAPKAFQLELGRTLVNVTTPLDAPVVVKSPFIKGTQTMYPFDRYLSSFHVVAKTTDSAPTTQLPVALTVVSSDSIAWVTSVRPTSRSDFDVDPPSGSLTIHVRREFNVYLVVLFVCIWGVTAAVGYVGSMTIVWETRPFDNPSMFISAFIAIPIFRNTAPGAPVYGCLFDIFSTFISFIVTLVCLLYVSLAYMKPKPPHPVVFTWDYANPCTP